MDRSVKNTANPHFVAEQGYWNNLSPETLDGEIWKSVNGFNGRYEISNFGRICSVISNRGARHIRKQQIGMGRGGAYALILIRLADKFWTKKIHRLVAEAFIPNPDGKPCINHKNGVRHDNRIENLEWCTWSENTVHAYKTGLKKKMIGEKHPMAKLTEKQVLKIRKMYDSGVSIRELAEKYSFDYYYIHRVVNKRSYKYA